jgi:hypothetical protein
VKKETLGVVKRESYLWGTGGNHRGMAEWSELEKGGRSEPARSSMLTSGRLVWFTTE